jgi:uncharacterized protein YutE (UPF0331/DUF86 family)
MVKPEVIRRRLARFNEYLEILEKYRRYDLEAFVGDPERYGSAERFLQLAIESTLDLGSHIISEEALGTVEQSRDIPRRFREHGLIDKKLEQQWIRMIGFRNILVHEYAELDRSIVYEVTCERLNDLRALGPAFAAFL